MNRTVPFEFFGEGQCLKFRIGDLRELERVLGNMPINEILEKITSFSVLSAGLMVGLKQYYRNKPISFFDGLIEKHLDDGGTLEALWTALSKALMVSGAFGKKVAEQAANAETNEDLANLSFGADDDGEPKNDSQAEANL